MQDIEIDKSGNNIIQKIDYNSLAKQFVDFFYNTWSSDPSQFVPSGLFTDYSRINLDGTIFASINIIHKLIEMQQGDKLKFEITKMNCVDSGSRRIDIMVNGYIYKGAAKYSFSQYFLIAHIKDSWKFHNSILNIFI
jgi:hypothetical protein